MRRLVLVVLGVLAFVVLPTTPASAHPLGNFTVNRYDGLLVSADGVRVDHVVDFAEIPTVQARSSVDTDADGTFAATELSAWAADRCGDEASKLELEVAGALVPLRTTFTRAGTVPGQAGLLTLRLECELRGSTQLATGATRITFTDDAAEQVGWREITVRGDGTTLTAAGGTSLRDRSVSKRLTAYPDNLLSSPLNERSVDFSVRPGGARAAEEGGVDGVLTRPTDRLGAAFTDTVGGANLGLGAAVAALLLAVVIGAFHAVAPGHGKTIMAFYLVGRGESRARAARGALTVGLTVTLTHTGGVLILGLIIASTANASPSSAYPWLGAASGMVIAAVGLGLLRAAWCRRGSHDDGHTHSHGFARPHSHVPGHAHAPAHDHCEEAHSHSEDLRHAHVPLEVQPHVHAHPHPHPHPHLHTEPADVGVRTGSTLVAPAPVETLHQARTTGEAAVRPPNVVESGAAARGSAADDGVVPNRRGRAGLVAVGIAGGLVPSPSALVVLLGAAAVGRAWFGVALVVAFGLGMAMTLSAVGLLLVVAQERVSRLSAPAWLPAARLHAVLPVLSALVVCVLGVFLVARGLSALP